MWFSWKINKLVSINHCVLYRNITDDSIPTRFTPVIIQKESNSGSFSLHLNLILVVGYLLPEYVLSFQSTSYFSPSMGSPLEGDGTLLYTMVVDRERLRAPLEANIASSNPRNL